MCNLCIEFKTFKHKTMGLMKEKFIQQREQEEYEQETLELYYKHLLLISDEDYVTQTEIINEIKK